MPFLCFRQKKMNYSKKRSRESRAAIERLYITMRQLIIRGSYKPSGMSGSALKEALLSLQPEIYGSLIDPEKVELDGLLYVAERLPQGIEECSIIKLIAREGFSEAGHQAIMPAKRRRNCYRIDRERMYVEMSRGRSDIYDILTHLTFLNIEADKIKKHALDSKGKPTSNWLRLGEVVDAEERQESIDEKQALVYLSNVLGRTVAETKIAVDQFASARAVNSLYRFVYYLGQVAVEERLKQRRKQVLFSAKLREVIGHHVYGEAWANAVKKAIDKNFGLHRPIHIVSANLHSFKNILFGFSALPNENFANISALATATAQNPELDEQITHYAEKNGLISLPDAAGTNLDVQIIDLAKVKWEKLEKPQRSDEEMPLLIVMDYAFGEQAYECMDELLKPYKGKSLEHKLPIRSVSVMGKAGILNGSKGEIMIPSAHVFEGTADNYPLDNILSLEDFRGSEIKSYAGTMVTVLGTSLQNRDVLRHFLTSTWNAVGIEMEGAHYQKAIQSAARIRKSIPEKIKVAYAYYASDNPLVSGSTLSSGSLGAEGIMPTYLISQKILEKILER